MDTNRLIHQRNIKCYLACPPGTQLCYSNVNIMFESGVAVAPCAMDILVKGNGLSKSCEVVCDSATSIGEVKKLFEHELDIPSMELRP